MAHLFFHFCERGAYRPTIARSNCEREQSSDTCTDEKDVSTYLEDFLRRGVLEGRHRPPQRRRHAEEPCCRCCWWCDSVCDGVDKRQASMVGCLRIDISMIECERAKHPPPHPFPFPTFPAGTHARTQTRTTLLTAQPRAVPDRAVHHDVTHALRDLAALAVDDHGERLRGEFHLYDWVRTCTCVWMRER